MDPDLHPTGIPTPTPYFTSFWIRPNIKHAPDARHVAVELLILVLAAAVVGWLTLRLLKDRGASAPLPTLPPHYIPLSLHRPLRLRLSHFYLDRQISQELHKIRIGLAAPPPELAMVRAMAMTRMDDFGYEPPRAVKPFAEGVRRALADVWRGRAGGERCGEVGGTREEEMGGMVPRVTFGGVCRYMILERAVEDVAVRLRIADYLDSNPDAREIEIPKIIVVTGLPDSGTAEIRDLLSLHPSLKVPTLWELASPIFPKYKQDRDAGLGSHGKRGKVGGKRVDPRHRRVMQFEEWAGKYVPAMKSGGLLGMDGFRYMSTLKPETAAESLSLLKDLLKVLLHQDAVRYTRRSVTDPTAPASPGADDDDTSTVAGHHGPGAPSLVTAASPPSPVSEAASPLLPLPPPRFPSAIVLEGPHHLPHLEALAAAFPGSLTVVWVHRDPASCALAAMRRTEVARACLMKPVVEERVEAAKVGKVGPAGGHEGSREIRVRSASHLDNRAGALGTVAAVADVLGRGLEQRGRLETKGVRFVDVTASKVFKEPTSVLVKDLLAKELGISAAENVLDRETERGAVSSIESAAAAAAVGWKVALGEAHGLSEEEARGFKGDGFEGWLRGQGGLSKALERFGVAVGELEEVKVFEEYAQRFGVVPEWEPEGKKKQ
ncbi:hypothetical protein HDU96_002948 [Phlyctochytrium bullatum]|nr:hypothetical protein HDU96_002948 [Phlyctochytrium bullatum]